MVSGSEISIHPPRVGWDGPPDYRLQDQRISIHPPRVGWDYLPRRVKRITTILIHPPRVGWDAHCCARPRRQSNFNPPTPCGAGLVVAAGNATIVKFQSTHPVWGGTIRLVGGTVDFPDFNPPTPCGVGPQTNINEGLLLVFQSTHPVWGGTAQVHKIVQSTCAKYIFFCWLYQKNITAQNIYCLNTKLLSDFSVRTSWLFMSTSSSHF